MGVTRAAIFTTASVAIGGIASYIAIATTGPSKLVAMGTVALSLIGAAANVAQLISWFRSDTASQRDVQGAERRIQFEADERHQKLTHEFAELKATVIASLAASRAPDAPPQLNDATLATEAAVAELFKEGTQEEHTAVELIAKGQVNEGLRTLRDIAEADTRTAARRWRRLGTLAYGVNVKEAIYALEKAATLEPNDTWTLISLCRLYLHSNILKAIEYGRKSVETSLTPHDKLSSLNALGDALMDSGNFESAKTIYQDAYREILTLYESTPAQPRYAHSLAVSLERLGEASGIGGDLGASIEHYMKGLEVSSHLYTQDRCNAEWALQFGLLSTKLAGALASQSKLGSAKTHLANAIEALLPHFDNKTFGTDCQITSSMAHERLGKILADEGDMNSAASELRTCINIRKNIADNDSLALLPKAQLSAAYSGLADVYSRQNDVKSAVGLYSEARRLADIVARADPENAQWQLDLSATIQRQATAEMMLHDPTAAFSLLLESSAIIRRLIDKSGSTTGLVHSLTVIESRLGDVALQDGKHSEALKHYEKDMELTLRLVKTDPENDRWNKDLSITYDRLGECHKKMHNMKDAEVSWGKQISILEALSKKSPTDTDLILRLATAHVNVLNLGFDRQEHGARALAILEGLHSKGLLPHEYTPMYSALKRGR